MVKERGETSNQNQATEEVAGQLLGRSIEGMSEANCSEICKMVGVRGETSNQNQATEEVAGQQFGRPIGAKHEVRQREICKMVGPVGLEPTTRPL